MKKKLARTRKVKNSIQAHVKYKAFYEKARVEAVRYVRTLKFMVGKV